MGSRMNRDDGETGLRIPGFRAINPQEQRLFPVTSNDSGSPGPSCSTRDINPVDIIWRV